MTCKQFLLILALGSGSIGHGASYYVSPNGSVDGTGTLLDPLNLAKALGSASPAKAGDTVWLRGGSYFGNFNCALIGASNNPVVVRQYLGERAIIDSTNVFSINGSGTWFWGLEFTDTSTNRYQVRGSGIGLNSGTGGRDNKLINCILHDLGNAIFVSYQSTNAEVAGCLIYNTGYQLPDRGHGHSLYVQNRSYSKQSHYRENICFNSFGKGFNIRSSFQTVNTRLTGNIVFNAGKLSTYGSDANYHTEGSTADQIFLDSNHSYYSVPQEGGQFYSWGATNGTIVLSNNVFANSFSYFLYWTNVVFNNNIQHVKLDVRPSETNHTSADYNSYYNVLTATPIAYNKDYLTLEQWQAKFGNDLHGTASASAPKGNWIYLRSNPYEPVRAHITIYNWDTNDTVTVDLSSRLNVGQRFEVRNAADYYAPPVISGIYSGGSITLPMTNLSVAVPIGMQSVPDPTGPSFNVFVLLQPPSPPMPPTGLRRLF